MFHTRAFIFRRMVVRTVMLLKKLNKIIKKNILLHWCILLVYIIQCYPKCRSFTASDQIGWQDTNCEQCLYFRFPHHSPVHASPHPIHVTCSVHLIPLDFITRTISGEEYRTLSSTLCSFLHSPVTSSLLGPHIFSSAPYSHTPSAYVSPSTWATKFHTHHKN
jgi:hypothetical protein